MTTTDRRRWTVAGLLLAACLLATCAREAQPVADSPAPSGVPVARPGAAQPQPSRPAAPLTAAPQPTRAPEPTVTPAERFDMVLTGATLFDGSGAPPLANAQIAIRSGTIAAVGPAGAFAYAPSTPTRDLGGNVVLPGFVDAHVHTHALGLADLRRWTMAGVTTVRDLQGPRDAIIARRNEVATSGDPTLPCLLVAELRHWIAAGLTPMQVIVAATHGSAVACGLAGKVGLVRAGFAADLLVVAGDPQADLGALERVTMVLHGGVAVRE